MRKNFVLIIILVVFLMVFGPLLLTSTKANSLGEGYLFFERMKVSTATDLTGMFTPSSDFSGTDPISLKIIFPEATAGTWCKVNASTLTIAGESSSPVDQGSWTIDAALPGTLVATCYQGSGGSTDYIEVTGITALTSGTSYGFTISANETNFVTGANSGSNLISYQLIEDTKVETLSFSVNLLADDQVVVTATVEDAETITCSILESNVNLGTLFRGGAYITGANQLTTDSTMGFYWAVYGEGNGSNAGLYNSAGAGYLLPSAGVEGEVNLLTGEGFGMLASSTEGYVPVKYTLATLGVFGSIGFGVDNASVFLYADVPSSVVNTSIIYGAKASVSALEGNYQETLTYICGGYVGATAESGSIEAAAFNLGWSCGADFADIRDSQVYSTVEIGTQCWMAENLNYDSGCSSVTWVDESDEGWCGCYGDNPNNCDIYGLLYQWSAAMNGSVTEGAQGICPGGWHVPTDAELHALEFRFATGTCDGNRDNSYDCDPAGTKLKSSTWDGDNSSEFTALPAGAKWSYGEGEYGNKDFDTRFWSSNQDGNNAWIRLLTGSSMLSRVSYDTNASGYGFSLRCIRD